MELSVDERRVVEYWAKGYSKTEAYSKVMLSPFDASTLNPAALKKRVSRFFNTQRMQDAMEEAKDRRGSRSKPKDTPQPAPPQKTLVENESAPPPTPTRNKPNYEAWLESLQNIEDPAALSIYGTGLFLAQTAVAQIMKRKKEISQLGLSALDPAASPYSTQDIAAIRAAASMILPFAPPPTTAERRAMSLAGIIVGLTEQSISESPDAYTAPIPQTAIDVSKEDD